MTCYPSPYQPNLTLVLPGLKTVYFLLILTLHLAIWALTLSSKLRRAKCPKTSIAFLLQTSSHSHLFFYLRDQIRTYHEKRSICPSEFSALLSQEPEGQITKNISGSKHAGLSEKLHSDLSPRRKFLELFYWIILVAHFYLSQSHSTG